MNYNDEFKFQALAKAILSTDLNPYSFMPKHYQSALTTSTSIENFLLILHHAMMDDGDVTFIKNGVEYSMEFTEIEYALEDIIKSEFHYISAGTELEEASVQDMIDYLNG